MDRAGWSYPSGDLRVSDSDRDRAVSELSEAFQAGRITADEFDQRSGQALCARTGNELTCLLADLPAAEPPAARPAALEQAQRIVATRIAIGASAVTAAILALTAVGNAALSHGASAQQLKVLQGIAVRHQGLPPPPAPLPSPGFNWAGTLTPAAIAVLLVVLIVYLRVRLARADRS
jgi:hypothetical protein